MLKLIPFRILGSCNFQVQYKRRLFTNIFHFIVIQLLYYFLFRMLLILLMFMELSQAQGEFYYFLYIQNYTNEYYITSNNSSYSRTSLSGESGTSLQNIPRLACVVKLCRKRYLLYFSVFILATMASNPSDALHYLWYNLTFDVFLYSGIRSVNWCFNRDPLSHCICYGRC